MAGPTFITFRRHYLDRLLLSYSFSGDVLDVGGKKENKRGIFRPPLDKVGSWKYLNMDAESKPDYLCSAEKIAVGDNSFDVVLMTEVLEHLERPELALAECARVLRPGGRILATMPFLFPVHGDPYDFQRWTPTRLKSEFVKAGFRDVEVLPMGGLAGVSSDLFETYCHLQFTECGRLNFWPKVLRKVLRMFLTGWLVKLDAGLSFQEKITTGYAVKAIR